MRINIRDFLLKTKWRGDQSKLTIYRNAHPERKNTSTSLLKF